MSITLLLAATLAPCVLVLAIFLVRSYPGRPVPPCNGTAETVFATINGVPQGLILTRRDPGHPVALSPAARDEFGAGTIGGGSDFSPALRDKGRTR